MEDNKTNFKENLYLGRKMLFLSQDQVCGAKIYGVGCMETDEIEISKPSDYKEEQWCLFKKNNMVVAKRASECFPSVEKFSLWVIEKGKKEWDRMEEEEREDIGKIIYG